MSKKYREEKRVKFRAGARTIILKPIPQVLLADVMSQDGKPEPPLKEREYLGGVIREEPDPEDEGYKQELALWQMTFNVRLLRVCVTFGVDTVEGPPPSAEVMGKIEAAYGKLTSAELRMRWIMYLIGDNINGFLNLAMGQTTPTQEGLADSEARFPSPDVRAGNTGADKSV